MRVVVVVVTAAMSVSSPRQPRSLWPARVSRYCRTVIGSFQVFDTVAVTTMGGPANATNVLQYYIYGAAFGRFQFGYASAMSVALLVVLSAITFLQYRLTRAGQSDLG